MRLLLPLSLLVLTFGLALFSTNAYSYVPFTVFSGLLFVTWLLHRYYKNIKIELFNDDDFMHIKLTQRFSVHLQGTYQVTCVHAISGEQQLITGKFSSAEHIQILQLHNPFLHCGKIELQHVRLVFHDPLGWYQCVKTMQNLTARIVLPSLQPASFDSVQQRQSLMMGHDAGAKERFTPYTPGDSIALIHWPLSAKLQALTVQKEAYAQSPSAIFALSFNEIEHIAQYDSFMRECYNLLLLEEIEQVVVWQDGWQLHHVGDKNAVEELFNDLLAKPLQQLYATTEPTIPCTVFCYQGGAAS